ncbi:amidohydrolase [Halocola ammonii]
MILNKVSFVWILLALALSSCMKSQQADLIVHNAQIYSMNESNDTHQAMAIKDGKILELGADRQILNKYSSKRKVDAQLKPVYPGFIDAHCHFLAYGLRYNELDLSGVKSFDEVVTRTSDYSKSFEGDWLLGRGWDQNLWNDKSLPNKALLDSLFPTTPVVLTRIDGHALLANQKAMDLAGIKKSTPVEGGMIAMKNGEMTGVFIDNAMNLINSAIPDKNREQMAEALMTAQENCFATGLTSIHDAGLMWNEIEVIDSLHQTGDLKMNVYAMLSDHPENYEKYLASGPYKTEKLNVRSFKFYADGALGSRGACLMHPYSDVTDSSYYGFLLSDPQYFYDRAEDLSEAGFQMNTHCIGDSAVHLILDVYADALGGVNDKRWRIEHAQVVNRADFDKFGEYSIIPSVQPTHATSDMHWADERLGEERLKNAYAYLDLKKQLGWIPLGTDFPIEDISPFETFQSAVFRQDEDGEPEEGFQPENALSRIEALKGMTVWAALAGFEEEGKGSLVPGKRADFIILDKDLMSVSEEDVLKTEVLKTFVSGEEVYAR